MERDLKITVDDSELGVAIAQAQHLVDLLREASDIINSWTGIKRQDED